MHIKTGATVLALAASASAAVSKVSRQGKFLVDASNQRFYIKGVAYQPAGAVSQNTAENEANGGFAEPSSYVDPLNNITACQRDLPYLQQLNINTVRVYNLDSTADHSACMNLFNDNSIYVIADLGLPLNGSINRAAPSWDVGIQQQYIDTINNMAGYDNLLAFGVANEVVTGPTNTDAAPLIKAAVRDVKAYLMSIGSSALTTYSATDGDDWSFDVAAYLTCGEQNTSVDLYGINNYRDCSTAGADLTFATSGYQVLYNAYEDLAVPAYFSEFGCITAGTRDWSEVALIYSDQMTPVFSGGSAFEFFADTDGYGLTQNLSTTGGAIVTVSDFAALGAAFAANNGSSSTIGPSTAVSTTCPAVSVNFTASAALPPTPNAAACACSLDSAFTCKPNENLTPVAIGELINYACANLGTFATCDAIASNGTTGVYGQFSSCTPLEKLGYAFTEYYFEQNGAAGSCSFSGNATVNSSGPSSASAVNSTASTCFASASGTSTPTSTGTTSALASTRTSSSSTGGAALTHTDIGIVAITTLGIVTGGFLALL
ncbi:carbohydrate-binding module family 43 protein [Mixia osmundae IAM 14324]|uniref:1,3-beta-glucanosyltransferase n=1 Tax=Mixia osmundae (strain CBS 9802 / IAM 14324 / JCM 22182 / KY 12970) TaxID=764103 RepID=G7E5B6_MIXOS|nr:carbohydrate-binding module family 43 protein [Mixia osmundae IAM 14324]KEI40824.1 carbohydrate-binding module family 43 protein [Mixia osmundae IAM 14324]GAA98026.1 hypothetical protein E5Q_04706 [Mixia osmundae IAM 14324]